MTREEAFNTLYMIKGYPAELKEGLFEIFERVYSQVSQRMADEHLDAYILDPDVVMSYLCEEHFFNLSLLSKENADKLINKSNYFDRLITIVCDKIFINEFKGYENESLLSEYNPLVSTFEFFLNFILNRFETMFKKLNRQEAVIFDVMKKGFLISKSVLHLLTSGYETEAFSTWRTAHEVECIVKILFENPYLVDTYIRHIDYARYYRNDFGDQETKDKIFAEIKEKMRLVELKSKDTKKYIEYGWLYSIKDLNQKFPEFKPNFRKGVELVAGLSEYSSIYEMSSELAHSSPLLIYSNKQYFRSLSLINIYETFFRLEEMLTKFLKEHDNFDSDAYFSMRKDYLPEMQKNIAIERIAFSYRFGKNK